MRDSLLDALLAAGAVTRLDAERVRSKPPVAGAAVSELTGAGLDEDAVLEAASVASGVPILPDKWLRSPKPPAQLPADVDTLVALRAAPVGTLRGELCLVYAEPELVGSPQALALPPHRAFLGRASDVERVLALARAASGAAPSPEPEPPPLPSGAISALPLPDDAATVFDTPRLDEDAFEALPTTEAEEPTAARPPSPRSLGLDAARERALAALPRYRVRGVLGRGGMATVYLADDRGPDDRGPDDEGAERAVARGERVQVALKLMEPHLAVDESFVERFRREARATSSLDHPNVVRTFDAGLEGETLYLASEYVDGGTLRDLLVATGPMPAALVAPILVQVLRGLAHAHAQGIVHRDLKPANILLSTSGVVKVGDFGVAKSQTDNTLTKSGMLFGTPAYMSPEQAFGRPLDGRSDVFSVATLAYELLTGRNPFHHENPSTSLLLVSRVSAPPLFGQCPTLPPLLDDVLARMMERDRGQRFPDAGAAADALEPLVAAIRARHGDVVADAVREPRVVVRELSRAQAAHELRRAQLLLAEGDERAKEAAFLLYRAQRLDPENPAAPPFLRLLIERHGFRFAVEGDAQLAALEEALTKKPDSPALLRRGAELSLAQSDLLGAVVWMRRYLRSRPGDLHMRHRLETILGADPLVPFSDGSTGAPQERAAPAPFILDAVGDTAYVRAVPPPGLLAKLASRPLLLFVLAAALLVGLITLPLLFE